MIFTYYPNDFWHKRKIDNFDPYNVLLAFARNIPARLMTGFVIQGHICFCIALSHQNKIKGPLKCLGIHSFVRCVDIISTETGS